VKISEVITRAISGKINWIQAAEILGMSDRQLRRWRGNWAKYGYDGLFDRRTQRPSPKRVPMADVERVLRLYREKYFDLNVKHFVEKLHAEEQISLSYTLVQNSTAECGAGPAIPEAGTAPQKASTAATDGDDAARRWQPASMDSWVRSIS
jgi:transposase